jgi:hypothetical protein
VVERHPSKLNVSGSNPLFRSFSAFFSEEELDIVKSLLMLPRWEFGHQSTPDSKPFWVMELEDDFFYDIFLQKIRPLLTKKYTVDRVYANGTTYGQYGTLHQDSLNVNDRTFLIYINAVSGTYFEGYGVHQPEENSALLFPGYIPHHSIGPPESFDDLRVTIAYKLLCK